MPRKKKNTKAKAPNFTKELLSYKTDEGVKTPVTRIVAGSNVTVERSTDVTGQFELDEVTISSTGSSGADVDVESEGTPVTGSLSICSGSIDIDLGDELKALSNFTETGIMSRTGVGTYKGRTLQAGDNITIINPDGVDGDPVISSTGGGGGGSNITLTGSVTGSGSGTINTSLFKRQIMPDGELGWYWGNSYPRIEHSIADDDYPSIRFSYGVIGFNERSWTQSFAAGKYGDYNGIYALDYTDDTHGNHRPFSIAMQPDTHKANIYFDGQISTFNNRITNVADPIDDQDVVTKKYLENSGGGSVSSVGINASYGITVTNSPITSSGNIVLNLDTELQKLASIADTSTETWGVVTRSDTGTYRMMNIVGGDYIQAYMNLDTPTAPTISLDINKNLDLKGFKITNLHQPVEPSDAANKEYVDSQSGGSTNITGSNGITATDTGGGNYDIGLTDYPDDKKQYINGKGVWENPLDIKLLNYEISSTDVTGLNVYEGDPANTLVGGVGADTIETGSGDIKPKVVDGIKLFSQQGFSIKLYTEEQKRLEIDSTGHFNFQDNRLSTSHAPQDADDLVNKTYVDNLFNCFGYYGLFTISTFTTSHLGTGDHCPFNQVWASNDPSGLITLSTSSYTTAVGIHCLGRVKLKAGYIYYLEGQIISTASTSYYGYALYDVTTTNTRFGTFGSGCSSSNGQYPAISTQGYIQAIEDRIIEVRKTGGTMLSWYQGNGNIGECQLNVRVVGKI